MLNKENSTEEIVYSPKDAVDLVNEFSSLFTSLDTKIKRFILTQPTFLGELRKQIKSDY
ncbi:MAG: hypothetical protein ACTSPI_11200 [Candidatus Heimdallarchaeaceae archaeon]